jgi:hypothetical protein
MKVRKLISAVAFAVVAAPIAAHADAPSGDFDQIFKTDHLVKAPQSRRSENRLYVEHWLEEQLAVNARLSKSRDQVRREIAAQPLPMIGA